MAELTLPQARALFLIEENKQQDFINLCQREKIDLNFLYDTPACTLLQRAILDSRYGIVKYLLDHGVKASRFELEIALLKKLNAPNYLEKFLGKSIYYLVKRNYEKSCINLSTNSGDHAVL